jgi:hypothetical protein
MFLRFKKKKPSLSKETKTAEKLIGTLLSLRVVRFALILIIFITLAPFILFLIFKPTPAKQINYGVTFSKKYAQNLGLDWRDTYIKILDDLRARNIRLVAYWDDSEPNPDNYRFDDIKWQLDEAQKRNAYVIMTIGRKVPRYPECFEPSWWKQIGSKERKDLELYEYIKNATLELKGYDVIKMWQIENEPFFPFGECPAIERSTVKKEIEIVRDLDKRPILVQDSGEGGFWYPSYILGDYLAISMYRKIWYDFWNVFLGNFIYFKYPLAHWTYKIKAHMLGVPPSKIIVTELQAEPWGPGINSSITKEEKEKTMSRSDFIATINYAQKTGFKDLYLWGAEWWLYEKEKNGNSFYWDTARALFN